MAKSTKGKKGESKSETDKPTDNNNNNDDENDSEEDEDYNPEEEDAKEKDDEGDDDPMEEEVVVDETNVLAPAQKKAVDEAFQEMFGYAWGTSFQLPRRNDQKSSKERMLVQIFGPVRAARILKAGGTLRPRRSVARRQAAQLAKGGSAATSTGGNSNNTTTSYSQQKSAPEYETKIFAGKAIQVPKSAGGNSRSSKKAPPKAAAGSGGGIDSVLQQISGPSKISTVAKTSSDWDSFKTETGLEAELEKKAQGKDAYLVKQDFLTRVDTRKFELEKDERNKERAKRGK